MFKKYPVLVSSVCNRMEMLRLAIEVFTGKRTRFVCLDLNTCHGRVLIGDEEAKLLAYVAGRDDLISFVMNDGDWVTALFSDDGKEVKVAYQNNPEVRDTVAGSMTLRWVGRSATDRRLEPLFLEDAQYCADVRNMTLEQLLNSKL